MQTSKIFTRLCWELGYAVKKRKESLIPFSGEDPREIAYLEKLPFTLMELPLKLGVGKRFYSLSNHTYHPLIHALVSGGGSINSREQAYKIIKKYSDLVNLRNANDFLGLWGEDAIFPEDSHPYGFTFPWSPLSPEEMKKNYQGYYSEENSRYGLKSDECLESVGVSEKKIHLEVDRLYGLMLSIKNKGYVTTENEVIGGAVLVKGEQWKWVVEGGQHRAAVVAALGFKKMPVYVKRIVRREEVQVWPGVRKRIYSSQGALKLFDAMFETVAPGSAIAWVDYVNEHLRVKPELEPLKNKK